MSPADYADHAEGMQQAALFRRERLVVVCLFMGNCVNLHKIKIEIMTENEISFKIRGAIFKVYDELGPGLLESIYEAALCYQMQKDGLKVENQTKLDVYYDNHLLPLDYRLDILVEDKVIIELKSVDEVTPVHFKQLLTYLKLANKRLGILVNFNADNISKAIYRKVNNL
jgi:GxxExxY protein